MKIPEFDTLQMVRTSELHFGNSRVQPATYHLAQSGAVERVDGIGPQTQGTALKRKTDSNSFESYMLEAVNTVNSQQLDVTKLQERLITDPDSVDIHDVTIAMSKARMSLNLAQTVIDRLVTGWNEISTTR